MKTNCVYSKMLIFITKNLLKKMEFKKHFLFSLFLIYSSMLFSQSNWTLNYDKSMVRLKKKKNHVLVLFTGSDWCPPCKMLERNILSTAEFEEYCKNNLILVKA